MVASPSLPRGALLVAALLAFLASAIAPPPYTDGDSCLYAALGDDMARDGARAWLAPTWSIEGRTTCFHDQPPGVPWSAAALQRLGLDDVRAPRVATALWLLLLVAATARLGGPLAAGILLLHLPVLRYAGRFSLEIPFAACAVAAVAAGRARGAAAVAALGLACAGAVLTRGVFALAVPGLLAADLLFARAPRARLLRVGAGLAVGAGLVLLFDLGHRAVAGHGFFASYLGAQVVPSLRGGGPFPEPEGGRLGYYVSRLLLYTAPWLPLAAVLFVRRRRGPVDPARRTDALLALLWIAGILSGAVLARREGSRYLFAAYPASAWLAALALRGWWERRPPRRRARVAVAVLLAVPLVVAVRPRLGDDTGFVRAAAILRQQRGRWEGSAVYGPFAPHDDPVKQFVRYHLRVRAHRLPPEGAPPNGLRLLEPGDPVPAGARVVLETPPFRLADVSPR